MAHEIREKVTVGPGGLIEIRCSELPEGAVADVVVTWSEEQPVGESTPLSSLFGKVRGCFRNGQEADAFLRAERDTWPL